MVTHAPISSSSTPSWSLFSADPLIPSASTVLPSCPGPSARFLGLAPRTAVSRCFASSWLMSLNARSFSGPSGRTFLPSRVYSSGCVPVCVGVSVASLPTMVTLIPR